ncbi:MAG: flippase activity-associated protein Agl23, partial [bacterium]
MEWSRCRDGKLNNHHKIILLSVMVLGILLRWWGLAERPPHHDEVLYAQYGFYFFENPETGFYRYDPILHGPLLFMLLPVVYSVFGTGVWAIRFLPALFGSLFIFAPLIFRKYLNRSWLILITTIMALSPLWIYYSRFLRHDYLVFFSMLLMLSSAIVPSKYKTPLFISGLAMHFAIKENSYITLAFLIGFTIYQQFFNKLFVTNPLESYLQKIYRHISQNKRSVFLAIGIFITIYVFCY